jgi:hypothetical protein
MEHLVSNNLEEPVQWAYKLFHSAETALLKVQNDILIAIDNHKCVVLLLLDMSSAFDTVNHEILLEARWPCWHQNPAMVCDAICAADSFANLYL